MKILTWIDGEMQSKPATTGPLAARRGRAPNRRATAATLVLIAGVLLAACTGANTPAVVAQGSPTTTGVKPSSAQNAVLTVQHGAVEIKTADGAWTPAEAGQTLSAGQHVRTGVLSNATLAFYDGSWSYLGSEVEVTVDALDANSTGARVVQLTQVSGESRHSVASSADAGSRFEVKTPAGSGSAAAAEFTVMVLPGQIGQFWVETGAVSVGNESVTVVVTAGQTTSSQAGQPPEEPALRISGEGRLTQLETVGSPASVILAAAYRTLARQNDKVTLCHATGSATNPYVLITVAAAGATNGHAKHEGDIIPAPAKGCPTVAPSAATLAASWTIAGQTFLTGPNTVVFGQPQPGDWVRFEGHVRADGARLADRIMVVNHNPNNQYSFSGQLESMGDTVWMVAGRAVQVDALTVIEPGLTVGDDVLVAGGITADGTFWATRLSQTDGTGSNFRFAGILASMSDAVWFISGMSITVDAATVLNGEFSVGQPVVAEGLILADGTWRATSIDLVTPGGYHFEFSGAVQSLSPWVVAGVGFDTAEWTEIDADLQVGTQVRVAGVISADGVWVAETIERLDTDHTTRFTFFGPVVSRDPWNVRGVALVVDERMTIKGDIVVGEMVKVTGYVLEDGTWLATEIKHTGLHVGQGCLLVSSVVQSLTDDEIILTDGQVIARSDELEVVGELQVGSLVRYQVCVDLDGVSTIRLITVVYQLDELPPVNGAKVVICHIPPGNPGNQHTIEVGQPAVAAHVAHDDTLGACANERPDQKPKKIK